MVLRSSRQDIGVQTKKDIPQLELLLRTVLYHNT